jgi:hypothetical protein
VKTWVGIVPLVAFGTPVKGNSRERSRRTAPDPDRAGGGSRSTRRHGKTMLHMAAVFVELDAACSASPTIGRVRSEMERSFFKTSRMRLLDDWIGQIRTVRSDPSLQAYRCIAKSLYGKPA